jgi:two-component system, LytTR family, response regulator LytT
MSPEGSPVILAVDDELPQLEDLARMLRANDRVGDVETASNAPEVVLMASRRKYDAVFLDVRMPEIDGLELAEVLNAFEQSPALVFVSAFDTSAVVTFELRALDYLTKPVTSQRIEEALKRVVAHTDERGGSVVPRATAEAALSTEQSVIAIESAPDGTMRLVPRESIFYVKAYGDYVRVFAESGRYLMRASLSDLELRFADHGFLRVHRQYLANLSKMIEIRPMVNGTAILRLENDTEVPVARRHVSDLRRRLRL